jgi:hypothetical protein
MEKEIEIAFQFSKTIYQPSKLYAGSPRNETRSLGCNEFVYSYPGE